MQKEMIFLFLIADSSWIPWRTRVSYVSIQEGIHIIISPRRASLTSSFS